MSKRRTVSRKGPAFPWLAVLLLLASIYLFWIYPQQREPKPIRVEFSQDNQ